MSDSDSDTQSSDTVIFAGATKVLAKGIVDGAGAFLSRICLPAAEEIGLLFQDRVRAWRAVNAVKLLSKAQQKYKKFFGNAQLHAHPRIVQRVLDRGSWTDDDYLLERWAGLLSSSCTEDGVNDSDLMLVSLLDQMTSIEARLLDYAFVNTGFRVFPDKSIGSLSGFKVPLDKLANDINAAPFSSLGLALCHCKALQVTDHELTYSPDGAQVYLKPKILGLHLFIRGQGFPGPFADYDYCDVEPTKTCESGVWLTEKRWHTKQPLAEQID